MNEQYNTQTTKTMYHKGGKMPLTKKGRKIYSSMRKKYGKKKGKKVFYASANKGTIKGVHVKGY